MKFILCVAFIIFFSALVGCNKNKKNETNVTQNPPETTDPETTDQKATPPLPQPKPSDLPAEKDKQLEKTISSFNAKIKEATGVYETRVDSDQEYSFQNIMDSIFKENEKVHLSLNISNTIKSPQLILHVKGVENAEGESFCSLFTFKKFFFQLIEGFTQNTREEFEIKKGFNVDVEHRGNIGDEQGIEKLNFKTNLFTQFLLYSINPWQDPTKQTAKLLQDEPLPSFKELVDTCDKL